VLLLLGLFGMALADGPRARGRRVVALVAALLALSTHASLALAGLVVVLLLLGLERLREEFELGLMVGTVLITGATHAVFFGAGRYGLVVIGALLLAIAPGALSACQSLALSRRRMADSGEKGSRATRC
jgi:hypothetical protein